MSSAVNFGHALTARSLLLYSVLLALWGTFLYFRNREAGGAFRASYLVLAGLTAVQGTLGALAFLLGSRPHNLLHVVYGIFAVIFLPGMYLYAQQGSKRREIAFLGIAAWIVTIAYLRGISTG